MAAMTMFDASAVSMKGKSKFGYAITDVVHNLTLVRLMLLWARVNRRSFLLSAVSSNFIKIWHESPIK